MLKSVIADGSALDKLAEFVKAQGGDAAAVYDTSLLPQASIVEEILSEKEGYIERIICDEIGICSLILGGGRETKISEIDLSVGLILHKKVGDYVKKGESLATIHANDLEKLKTAKERFLNAYVYTGQPKARSSFIKDVIS